jgi:hypothetical protein
LSVVDVAFTVELVLLYALVLSVLLLVVVDVDVLACVELFIGMVVPVLVVELVLRHAALIRKRRLSPRLGTLASSP